MTVKKIANCNNINRVNPLHFNEMIGHFEEKHENKSNMGKTFKKIGLSLMMTCQ